MQYLRARARAPSRRLAIQTPDSDASSACGTRHATIWAHSFSNSAQILLKSCDRPDTFAGAASTAVLMARKCVRDAPVVDRAGGLVIGVMQGARGRQTWAFVSAAVPGLRVDIRSRGVSYGSDAMSQRETRASRAAKRQRVAKHVVQAGTSVSGRGKQFAIDVSRVLEPSKNPTEANKMKKYLKDISRTSLSNSVVSYRMRF